MSWFDHNREVAVLIVESLYRSAANHADQFPHDLPKTKANQPVESLMVVDLPLVFTDSIPLSHEASLAYI
jgi:hypothetical protein